jgi:hypothetical protein
MTIAGWLFSAACGLVSLLCALAVLAHSYSDTLTQRLALAGLSIGALAIGWDAWAGAYEVRDMYALFVGSAALFAAETARKVAWRRHKGVWHDAG